LWLGGPSRYSAAGRRIFYLCCVLKASNPYRHIVTRKTPQPQPALGRAIRDLRNQRGLSLRALAPKAGVTANTLSLIERGEANPTWGAVRGIATALGVSISRLAKLAEKYEQPRS
jgi:DNA-binding XRE family transcriptional regulator